MTEQNYADPQQGDPVTMLSHADLAMRLLQQDVLIHSLQQRIAELQADLDKQTNKGKP